MKTLTDGIAGGIIMEEYRVFGVMDMQMYTKITGGFLVLLGVGFYLGTGMASITAVIPAFFGIPILLMGILSEKMPDKKSIFMHIAVVLGVLCLVGGTRSISGLMAGDYGLAVIEQFVLMLTGLEYTIISVLSFIHARKSQAAE